MRGLIALAMADFLLCCYRVIVRNKFLPILLMTSFRGAVG
jgi:hypothetical protein